MPRRPDKKLRVERRKQILEAAKRCFIVQGFHQTTMRQILDAAGLSAGGAYNYFASKSAIVEEIIEEQVTDIDFLGQQLRKSDDPLDGLVNFVDAIIRHTSRDEAILMTEIYAEACRDPASRERMQANTQKLKDVISATIDQGRASGRIKPSLSNHSLTGWVIALYEGYIGRIASDPTFESEDVDAAAASVREFLGQ